MNAPSPDLSVLYRAPPTDRDVLEALSHKLGSPLGATVNFLHLVKVGGQAGDALDGIAAATTSARTLLDASRRWMEATAMPMHGTVLDPGPLLERAAEAAGLAGRIDVSAVPRVHACPNAFGMQWREVFANCAKLLAPDAHVRVQATAHDGIVEIAAADPGPGWSSDEAVRAFEAFSTLPGRIGGAGMGLPIVAALAARQGGRAAGRPAPGGGAEVILVYRTG